MANLSNINNILRISSSGVGLNKDNTGPSELDIESAGADMIDMTRTGLKTYRFAISGSSDFSIFDVAANTDRLTINSAGNATFSGSVTASAFLMSNGSLTNNSFWGTTLNAGSGSYADFALLDSGTTGIMHVPTGTRNVVFYGQVTTSQPNSGLDYPILIGVGNNGSGAIGYQTRAQFNDIHNTVYNIDASNSASSQWLKVGTLSNFAQGGNTFVMCFYGHTGYNASNSQDWNFKLFMKTSNGNAGGPHNASFNTWVEYTGNNTASPELKWVNTNASGTPTVTGTSFVLYMNVPQFAGGSIYTINKHSGNWTSNNTTGQSDPGANSSTVLQAEHIFNILDTNVGIGTTSPQTKLQTNLAITGTYLAYLNGTSAAFDAAANIAAVHNSPSIGSATAAGLVLANNDNSNGAPSPIIAFSAKSASNTFNHTYAAIYGVRTASGADTNWTKGDIVLATGEGTGPKERMRITSGGEIQVGNAVGSSDSNSGTRISASQMRQSTAGTGAHDFHDFYRGTEGSLVRVGNIRTTGTTTAYNTSSDYRLKEDLQDFKGLDLVSKIPVYDFKWKIDESRSYGVMAHELQEVLPDAVSGYKDEEEMQGVDYSKIVPLLVKSIQELKADNDSLKARIKTLENN